MSSKDTLSRVLLVKSWQEKAYDEIRPLLFQAFEDKNYSIRSAAIQVFGEIGNKNDVDKLFPLLKDPHYEVRYLTAETLGFFNNQQSISYLIDSLDDVDEVVRLNSADSLGKLKAKYAIPKLIEKLTDKDELVRGYAAEALGVIGDKNTVYALKKALLTEKRNASRVRILTALFKLGEESNLSLIIKMLNTKSYRVRCATANILTELSFDNNIDGLYGILEQKLKNEKTVAVKSTITRCLKELASDN
ncbi:HEAT repeat domain-containing protein [Methylovulum psychrotolerans]|uniref:HEAT repeat domain-containing protein n=1 Tax=Methylovulum psychrotolerans TaxID=1704499 RepID=A0A1Z4BVV7_9GAMM|nr:HEAT repeat domain-containing protein [Methylovulum psychrotolerans]ASF45339.1 hypothetical protein CEK71_04245 [Methylovulum psychrotolerans]